MKKIIRYAYPFYLGGALAVAGFNFLSWQYYLILVPTIILVEINNIVLVKFVKSLESDLMGLEELYKARICELEKKVKKEKTKNIPKKEKVTISQPLNDFANINKSKMSPRLYNVLILVYKYGKYNVDIKKNEFIQYRNAGIKSWEEFVKLRGY